jgi:hypothetical protein
MTHSLVPQPPKRKLRWYQFSLQSLLVFVTLFAFACSWFAVKMQQAKRQNEFVEEIRKAGGEVTYDYESNPVGSPPQPPQPAWLVHLLGDDFFNNIVMIGVFSDDLMIHLRDLPKLHSLLAGEKVTDAGLENLKGLSQLKNISLRWAQITDAGLEHVKDLTQLKDLDLTDTQVTDAGLGQLKGLENLEFLGLMGTRVTDEGLKNLKEMEHLKSLNLNGTQVTDVGLEHLKRLNQLQNLWLQGTKITDAGVDKLKQALPNVKITR